MATRTLCFGMDVHRDPLVLDAADKATGLLWLPFHMYLTKSAALNPFQLQLIRFCKHIFLK